MFVQYIYTTICSFSTYTRQYVRSVHIQYNMFVQYTCLHELGHTLALYHEHQNPLRGDVMELNWDRVPFSEFVTATDLSPAPFERPAL